MTKKLSLLVALLLLTCFNSLASARSYTEQKGIPIEAISTTTETSSADTSSVKQNISNAINSLKGGLDILCDKIHHPKCPSAQLKGWLNNNVSNGISVYAFAFTGGGGAGIQAAPFRRYPIGLTADYWESSALQSLSFSAGFYTKIDIFPTYNIFLIPGVSLGYYAISSSNVTSFSKAGITLRIHPELAWTLPFATKFDIKVGYLYNTYSTNTGNLTLGIMYNY